MEMFWKVLVGTILVIVIIVLVWHKLSPYLKRWFGWLKPHKSAPETPGTEKKEKTKKSWGWAKFPWGKVVGFGLIAFLLFGTPTGRWLVGGAWNGLMAKPDFNATKVLRPYDGALYWEETSGLTRYQSWQHLTSWVEEGSPTASGEPPLLFGGTMPPQEETRLTFAPRVSTQASGTDRWYWAMFARDARLASEDELQTLLAGDAGVGSFPQTGHNGKHKNPFEEVYLVALRGFPADGPQQVQVTRSSIPGVEEYLLTVSEPNQYRLTVPEGVRYMWIVAPPCYSWETKYAGEAVPPEGLVDPEIVADRAYMYAASHGRSHEEAEEIARGEALRFTTALETQPTLNFLATYYQVDNEKPAPITYSRTFSHLDAGRTVTIGVNAPGGVNTKDAARVIVGFSR